MLIEHVIKTMAFTRRHFLDLTGGCSPEEMNNTPKGFSNNLAWNLGHVVSSQQTLCYVLSDIEPRVERSFIDLYKPGSAPGAFVTAEAIEHIRNLVRTTIEQLQEDYHAGLFKVYSGRQTKYGPFLANIDEAIAYLSTHETLHFGFAKALLRSLRS